MFLFLIFIIIIKLSVISHFLLAGRRGKGCVRDIRLYPVTGIMPREGMTSLILSCIIHTHSVCSLVLVNYHTVLDSTN